MWKDEIVENVRKTRDKILQEANYDLSIILNEIKEMQIKDKDRLVSFASKELLK